jgi:hypothetical protein
VVKPPIKLEDPKRPKDGVLSLQRIRDLFFEGTKNQGSTYTWCRNIKSGVVCVSRSAGPSAVASSPAGEPARLTKI